MASCAGFLTPAATGVIAARSRARRLGLSRKPDASRQPSPQVNVISNSLCQVLLYERYGKIQEGADNAKKSATGTRVAALSRFLSMAAKAAA